MLVAHVFGASLVEGIITALGFAYMQQHHPEYLTSLRVGRSRATPRLPSGQTAPRPLWQLVGGGVVAAGGGPGRSPGWSPAAAISRTLFGADWSTRRLAGVATMLLIVARAGGGPDPARLVRCCRARIRAVGTAYVAVGGAGAARPDRARLRLRRGQHRTTCSTSSATCPRACRTLSGFFSAPFKDYNLPLPFFSDADAPLWHAAIGYEIAGLLGMLLLGADLVGHRLGAAAARGRSRLAVARVAPLTMSGAHSARAATRAHRLARAHHRRHRRLDRARRLHRGARPPAGLAAAHRPARQSRHVPGRR